MKQLNKLLILFLFLSIIEYLKAAEPSGSLPVMIINTEGNAPIVDKENYIKATYSIDPKDDDSIEASEGTLQIRGRGNYTWSSFDKKPYRLKLDEKAPLLGYKKSKHFVLMAHADDNLGFLREPMGFKMSELAGMAWTPGQKPVELIINGDYRGLYFLVENIRIDKDRVNIFDQEDENPSSDVTGGWLCELDNYEEPASEQITIKEGNGDLIRITHHSPEEINKEQENYLREQMIALDKAFYIQDPDSRDYENLVDLNSLVTFYVLQELMDGQESFHGSSYFHRDRGEDKKWVWGPVWDFGNTYMRSEGYMIYERPDWGQTWIDQIVKFKSFQEAYKIRFQEFLDFEYEDLRDYIKDYSAVIATAAISDAKRWPQYGNSNLAQKCNEILDALKRRIVFLGDKWNIDTGINPGLYIRGDFNNWNAYASNEFNEPQDGTYIYEGEDFKGRFKIADYNWSSDNWGTVIVNQDIPLDTPVELINGGESKDMMSPGGFNRVIFRIIEPGVKATVELSTSLAGVNDIQMDKDFLIKIRGRYVSSEGQFSVYDSKGMCIATNISHIELQPGLYILKGEKSTQKVLIK